MLEPEGKNFRSCSGRMQAFAKELKSLFLAIQPLRPRFIWRVGAAARGFGAGVEAADDDVAALVHLRHRVLRQVLDDERKGAHHLFDRFARERAWLIVGRRRLALRQGRGGRSQYGKETGQRERA